MQVTTLGCLEKRVGAGHSNGVRWKGEKASQWQKAFLQKHPTAHLGVWSGRLSQQRGKGPRVRTERGPEILGRSRAQRSAGVEMLGHHLPKRVGGALLSHGPIYMSGAVVTTKVMPREPEKGP